MPGRNPDLGEHLWQSGFADQKIILILPDIVSVAEAPGQSRDVSFHITLDEGRFCGTLNTVQQAKTIARLAAAGGDLVVEGRLARDTVTGQGGEQYRLIHGFIIKADRRLPPKTASKRTDEPD